MKLRLSVQYASARPAPKRDQVRRWVRAALADAADATLTVRFVDEDEGRSLNRTFRGKDYATNVLTFPLSEDDERVEADIVVCLPVVEVEARAQGKHPTAHCAHLVVHGVLHARDYDHDDPREAATMEALERQALERFGIADPYAADD